MNDRVVFYQLTHKFVSDQQCIPEDARQVIYYSLAIGHHVGVLDCFNSFMEIPIQDYREWINRLPEGISRNKMEGVLKWGEVEINSSHSKELLAAFNSMLPLINDNEAKWTGVISDCLQKMAAEPALYLMVRKRS